MSVVVDLVRRQEQLCLALEHLLHEHRIAPYPNACCVAHAFDDIEADAEPAYVFWTEDDQVRLESTGSLLLSYGTNTYDDERDRGIAAQIVSVLRKGGFEVRWSGDVNERIEVIL